MSNQVRLRMLRRLGMVGTATILGASPVAAWGQASIGRFAWSTRS